MLQSGQIGIVLIYFYVISYCCLDGLSVISFSCECGAVMETVCFCGAVLWTSYVTKTKSVCQEM